MPTPRPQRSVPRRIAAVSAAAGVLALALSGCVGAPAPTPTPSASSPAPIFASDEEALAAAEAAYEQFLIASAQATGSGGTNLDALDEVAIGDAYKAQRESAAAYVKDSIRSTGQRTFKTHQLQSHSEDSDRGAVVAFYVCDDLRALDVVDAAGVSVVAPDRVVDVPYLIVVEGKAGALKVSEKDLWERENFCL